MLRGPEKPSEYHRYRQVLAAAYLGTITAGVLLLAASVVAALYLRPAVALSRPPLDAHRPDTGDLLECNRQVAALYDDLSRTALALLAQPARPAADDTGALALLPAWEQFSLEWVRAWDEVNAWCRFSELAGSHMGDAYDRMAEVHADLRIMRLKYQGLLTRFDDEQARQLGDMRRALERSRRVLETSVPPNEEPAQ